MVKQLIIRQLLLGLYMFPLRSLHMFGNAAHWKSQIQNFTSSGTKAAGGWTPGRGPGWRSSLARPLREGQVESEIRRAQGLVGESMRLQAPNVRIFALKSSRGQMGTCYSEAVSCPLHVSIAVSAHVRNCCSLEEPNSEFHFVWNKSCRWVDPRQRPWMAVEPCSAPSRGSSGE